MKVCFLTTGSIKWASSRLRAFWVAERMDDAVAMEAKNGANVPDADVYVFQKAINIDLVKALKDRDKRIIWDICDPVHWFTPIEARQMTELVDVIVASNEGLALDFENWSGREATVIPDRMNLDHYNKRKRHKKSDSIRFIWFGSAQNRESLLPAYIILERLGVAGYNVELTVYDDRPDIALRYGPSCPIYMSNWEVRTEVKMLTNHDIAILPPYPGEWGSVKSNNKTLTAWACGLAVSDGMDYIETSVLMDPARRQEQADHGLEVVRKYYDIRQSVAEWEALLDSL